MAFSGFDLEGGRENVEAVRKRGRSSIGHWSSSQCICTHYGRNNHTIENYFMKHIYPPGYNYRSSKPWINNIMSSTPIEESFDSIQDIEIHRNPERSVQSNSITPQSKSSFCFFQVNSPSHQLCLRIHGWYTTCILSIWYRWYSSHYF